MTKLAFVSLSALLVAGVACVHPASQTSKPDEVRGVIIGAFSPANPAPAPALARGQYEGEFIVGFETQDFIACGSKERWWVSGDLAAATQFRKEYPEKAIPAGWRKARLYLRVLATPSATGNHGHLGQYPRELEVHEILQVREYREEDCTSQQGA